MSDASKIVKNHDFRWDGVPIRRYKAGDAHFKDITKQVLLGDDGESEQALNFITRYFEIEPDGYSSLEHHNHPHAVVIVRGRGTVLLGESLHDIEAMDCVYVAPDTLHQFHAGRGEPLGFLCVVDRERDRPSLPTKDEVERLARDSGIREAIRGYDEND